MRRTPSLLAGAGAALLAVAVPWAYVEGADPGGGVTLLLVGGVLLALAAVNVLVLGERRPDRLVADESVGIPEVPGGSATVDRGAVLAARRVRSFGARHGGDGRSDPDVDLVVEHLGRDMVRLVLVAADGAFGDIVVRGPARARRAAQLSGARVHESFPAELTSRLGTGPYEWQRMAGQQLGGGR